MDTTNRIYQKFLPHNNQKKKKQGNQNKLHFFIQSRITLSNISIKPRKKLSLKSMALKSTFRSHESVFVSSTYKYFVLQEPKDEIYRINLFRKKNEKEKQ